MPFSAENRFNAEKLFLPIFPSTGPISNDIALRLYWSSDCVVVERLFKSLSVTANRDLRESRRSRVAVIRSFFMAPFNLFYPIP